MTAAPALDSGLFQDDIDLGVPRAVRMIEAFAPDFQDDPTIRAYVCTLAREFDRVEAFAQALRIGTFPAEATEATLVYYERLFGLSNTGLTTAERRQDVVAHMRKHSVASRYDWQTALGSLIGLGWSYEESLPYTLLLTVPVDISGARVPVITDFARAITPAHLLLVVNGDYGSFQVGISHLGIDPL